MALRFPARVKARSSTIGTGTLTIDETITTAGWRTFTRAVTDLDLADGDQVPFAIVDTTVTNGPKLVEISVGTWNNSTKTLTRDTVYQPNSNAVNWGVGWRDVVVVDNPAMFLLLAGGTITGILKILLSGSIISPAAETAVVIQRSASSSTDCGLSVISGTAGKSRVNLGDTADEKAIAVIGDNNLNKLIFRTNGADGPSVDSSGVLRDPSGTAYLTSAGTASVPSGAVTDWYMAAAPSGWTRVTTINDKVPIIVSAGSPGTASASVWDISGLSVDGHTLTTAEIPSHSHTYFLGSVAVQSGAGQTVVRGDATSNTGSTGGGDPHTHTISSTGTWRPPAAYFLLASKN